MRRRVVGRVGAAGALLATSARGRRTFVRPRSAEPRELGYIYLVEDGEVVGPTFKRCEIQPDNPLKCSAHLQTKSMTPGPRRRTAGARTPVRATHALATAIAWRARAGRVTSRTRSPERGAAWKRAISFGPLPPRGPVRASGRGCGRRRRGSSSRGRRWPPRTDDRPS